MQALRRFLLTAGIVGMVAAAYCAGAKTGVGSTSELMPGNVIPDLAAAPLAEVNVPNPTAILLGEVKVPDNLLVPAPSRASGLIVPEIEK